MTSKPWHWPINYQVPLIYTIQFNLKTLRPLLETKTVYFSGTEIFWSKWHRLSCLPAGEPCKTNIILYIITYIQTQAFFNVKYGSKSVFPFPGSLVDKFGQFGAICYHGDDCVYSAAERTLTVSKENRCDFWCYLIWLHWLQRLC